MIPASRRASGGIVECVVDANCKRLDLPFGTDLPQKADNPARIRMRGGKRCQFGRRIKPRRKQPHISHQLVSRH